MFNLPCLRTFPFKCYPSCYLHVTKVTCMLTEFITMLSYVFMHLNMLNILLIWFLMGRCYFICYAMIFYVVYISLHLVKYVTSCYMTNLDISSTMPIILQSASIAYGPHATSLVCFVIGSRHVMFYTYLLSMLLPNDSNLQAILPSNDVPPVC